MNEGLQRIDPEVRKADARDARDLLEDRIFSKAINDLHEQALGKLMVCKKRKEIFELVAQLQALKAVPLQLNHYVNSEKKAVQDAWRR
jgi:hypothetical protein